MSYENVDAPSFPWQTDLGILVLSNPPRGQEALRSLRQKFDGPVLVVGGITDSKVILRTLQLGADLYLDEADVERELGAALNRLLHKQESSQGRLLSVVSASGGCGVSTLAVNLAVALARDRSRCLLLDLNPGRGDLSALLDLKPQFSLADVCANEERLDQAILEKMLARHGSGVLLLGSPPEYADVRRVTPCGLHRALNLCRTLYPDIIADLEDAFHSEQIEVLKQSTNVLVVCRLDFTTLKNTRRLLAHLRQLDLPRTRIKVVVNQHGLPGELPLAEAEDAVGEKIAYCLPHDAATINAANNTGVPVVLKHPKSKFAQSILGLLNLTEKADSPSGLFPNLKRILHDAMPVSWR